MITEYLCYCLPQNLETIAFICYHKLKCNQHIKLFYLNIMKTMWPHYQAIENLGARNQKDLNRNSIIPLTIPTPSFFHGKLTPLIMENWHHYPHPINIYHIGPTIGRYCRLNIVSGGSKPNMTLSIYIGIGRYLKQCC